MSSSSSNTTAQSLGALTTAGAGSTCKKRTCTTGVDCAPYAQQCNTVQDCTPRSCCVVLDLDIIDSNIPARALPEASIHPCGDGTEHTLFCGGVCGFTIPDWGTM